MKVKDEDLSVNTMLLDVINKLDSIDWNVIILSIIVSIVACVVIYGVFNISIYQRTGEYGILRAIGAKRGQIFNIILSEENFDKICGFDNYRILHVNKSSNSNNDQILEQILSITNNLEGISARDLSKERVETEGYYKVKDSYVYIISIVLFIISMLNIPNNISYRLMSRTNEFGMLRAVGLDDKEFKELIKFEGLSFGIIQISIYSFKVYSSDSYV
ncbi:ABC transporter permease [Paeniclostridium hominis]|uniref:ABC transporter permease n=1 Tax=Paeniclostridium hominis TaxID=2764329 RepID=UPI0022E509A4|nr:FtsX-like permease family protein [Paeniclostridium hominis]